MMRAGNGATDIIDRLNWEPLFVMRLSVGYDRAQPIGATAAGIRGVYPVDGGTFEGKRLRGSVNAGGADWVTMRSDAMMLIDVRLSLNTDDGATIGMVYSGLARPNDPANNDRFLNREVLPYEDMYLHTTPRFETGDTRYAWINGVIAVTNGRRVQGGGEYHVFAIL
jgi:Protein of unknown function (DUF3237)